MGSRFERIGPLLAALVLAALGATAHGLDAQSSGAAGAGHPGIAYDPPAGVYPYFASSPFLQRIPNPPTVNPNSASWVADAEKLGPFGIGTMHAYYSRSPNKYEIAFPVYLDHQGSDTPVRIHCLEKFGGGRHPCNIEGMIVNVDPRELPQNGGEDEAHDLDAHWALIDPEGGYEYDTWQTRWPPENGVLTVGWGGRCALNGDGFSNPSYTGPHWNSGCTATASGTPLSMGIVRVKDLLAAAKSGAALPAALSLTYGCSGRVEALPAPFLGSGDGKCLGAPPEGARVYLAMHDSEIGALGVAPVVAVLLRTLDEDHFGGFIVDTESGPKPGFGVNVESDQSYAAWGMGSPWLEQFVPEARREGVAIYEAPLTSRSGIRLDIPREISWEKVRFL